MCVCVCVSSHRMGGGESSNGDKNGKIINEIIKNKKSAIFS